MNYNDVMLKITYNISKAIMIVIHSSTHENSNDNGNDNDNEL